MGDPYDMGAKSFIERRRALSKNIASLHASQRHYMPGTNHLIDALDPVRLADHPENVTVWLPSTLPPTTRNTQCAAGLPELEYRLRYAQAVDALHDVRRFRRLFRAVTIKLQAHISGTQTTRKRGIFDRVSVKLARAVSRYRAAWRAINALAPKEEFGVWKKFLLKLEDCDIRGPGPEPSEPSKSRFIQSWIWTTAPQASASIDDPDLHAALRVEWCKAQERAKRYEEEIELVVEEMRRTLATFTWNADEWERRAASVSVVGSTIDETTALGIVAYAYKQANIQRRMVKVFIDDWYDALDQRSLGSSWLSEYSRPSKDKHRRLISNVGRYHSDSVGSNADILGADDEHDDQVPVGVNVDYSEFFED